MNGSRPQVHLPRGEDFLLLPPTSQAFAYANVGRMFSTRTISRGERVMALPYGAGIAPDCSIDRYMERCAIAGLLVIEGGHIRLERYALGLAEDTRWTSMSMVKSMTSTLVGAAMVTGAIGGLDERVSMHIPELRGSAYDAVTIRHLLTMSSGVRWNEDYTDKQSDVNRYSASLANRVPGGVLEMMRRLPPEHAPGSRFNYNTGDTYVLGRLVSAATGMPLAQFMSDRIWARFGMEFDAFYTLESADGQEIGGSRAGFALRDLGRFGLFLLSDGVVDGERVLPSGWVADAGRTRFELDPASNRIRAIGYGYSWWLEAAGGMTAVGFAGQSLHIDRDSDLVIVTLACEPQPPFDAAYGIDFRQEATDFRRSVVGALGGGD